MSALDWYCLLWGIASATADPVLPEDLMRFPGKETTAVTVRFIQEHQGWLEVQRGQPGLNANDGKVLRVWNWESRQAYAAWYQLQWCHVEPDNCEMVIHLTDLRRQIGWENYVNGRMPAPVPYWRFQRDD